ncbi:siderophore-interacting protein [Thermocrispum sp.]|jgi:NADPH-dependent ferric siderophore reductase|uniref:siderophore-interacting protein n=1 Tax=Thermocrispum sp. TaxID=2060768 RepID=UPI0025801EF0|nr:siderophore-interacting protein [Thermocrispum sp.]
MPKPSRGFDGLVVKAWRGRDYRLTVRDSRYVTDHCLRLSFDTGELLDHLPVHPTMWVRLWIPNGRKLQQRAFTLVDPDPRARTTDIEFALHDGSPATEWARAAEPGDTIDATVLGTRFTWPRPDPSGYLIVGDTASLPAINSLLAELNGIPARVWLEWQHEDDQKLPVSAAPGTEVTWVQRTDAGAGLVKTVEEAAFCARGRHAWVACDTKTTRRLVGVLRDRYQLDRKAITAMGYWRP